MLVERHADLQVAQDYAQLSNAALGDGGPTPQHWPTVEEWAGALDPGSSAPPSVAFRVCARWATAIEGYSRRLIETKGVVASLDGGNCNASSPSASACPPPQGDSGALRRGSPAPGSARTARPWWTP